MTRASYGRRADARALDPGAGKGEDRPAMDVVDPGTDPWRLDPRGVRPDWKIRQQLSTLRGIIAQRRVPEEALEYYRGGAAGLAWMLGESSTGPISRRTMRDGVSRRGDELRRHQLDMVMREAMWSEEVALGARPRPFALSRSYADGTAYWLFWALGRDQHA
jgi:hypothetical protein